MLTGISVYVNVAAIICVLIALPLFIGATRRGFFDKNSLLGFILLATALVLHGGFQTVVRSSPRATFSGYVQGWTGGGNSSESSLWIYDLGFPPAKTPVYAAPYRNLELAPSRDNPVPGSFWDTAGSQYVKCEYRTWDLEIVRIDSLPVPNAGPPGSSPWTWKSDAVGRNWPLFEALLGLLVAGRCAWLFGKKKQLPTLARAHRAARLPNKWAARIYATAVFLIISWIVFVRLSDRFFQHRAQVLLEKIQRLELRKSTWQDADQIRDAYRGHVDSDADCSRAHCDFTVRLDHEPPLMWSRFGPIAWAAWSLPQGRWAEVDATVQVRDGVVWGKDFAARISHREGYALIASAHTTRDFGAGSCDWRNLKHPNLRFGRPGGCEICKALWATVTPYASADEMRDAFAFDLSCIGATLRRCTEMSQIMPAAARRMEEDSRLNSWEGRPGEALAPATIRACGRDTEIAAIATVVRIDQEYTSDTHERIDFVDYKLNQVLKGTATRGVLRETFYSKVPQPVPHLSQDVIVFGTDREAEAWATLTDSNLHEVREGIAEDAVDILRGR